MTGYHISIGYNSALNSQEKRDAFTILKDVVEDLRVNHRDLLIDEVLREHPLAYDRATLKEYADSYQLPPVDATVTIIEPKDGEPGSIMQMASGGGASREIKEMMRRAFCRLVIFRMHQRSIEVNLSVT